MRKNERRAKVQAKDLKLLNFFSLRGGEVEASIAKRTKERLGRIETQGYRGNAVGGKTLEKVLFVQQTRPSQESIGVE